MPHLPSPPPNRLRPISCVRLQRQMDDAMDPKDSDTLRLIFFPLI